MCNYNRLDEHPPLVDIIELAILIEVTLQGTLLRSAILVLAKAW